MAIVEGGSLWTLFFLLLRADFSRNKGKDVYFEGISANLRWGERQPSIVSHAVSIDDIYLQLLHKFVIFRLYYNYR